MRVKPSKGWKNVLQIENNLGHDSKKAGKKQTTPLKNLSVTNSKIIAEKAIADLLKETLSKYSSCQGNKNFLEIKQSLEKRKKLSFIWRNSKYYHKPFKIIEYVDSIDKSHDTAVDLNEIH